METELVKSLRSELLECYRHLEMLRQKVERDRAHHNGLWAIDRNPNEVDLEWIRKNAYQITI